MIIFLKAHARAGKRKVAGGGGSGDEDRNVNAELMGKDIEFVLLEFG